MEMGISKVSEIGAKRELEMGKMAVGFFFEYGIS